MFNRHGTAPVRPNGVRRQVGRGQLTHGTALHRGNSQSFQQGAFWMNQGFDCPVTLRGGIQYRQLFHHYGRGFVSAARQPIPTTTTMMMPASLLRPPPGFVDSFALEFASSHFQNIIIKRRPVEPTPKTKPQPAAVAKVEMSFPVEMVNLQLSHNFKHKLISGRLYRSIAVPVYLDENQYSLLAEPRCVSDLSLFAPLSQQNRWKAMSRFINATHHANSNQLLLARMETSKLKETRLKAEAILKECFSSNVKPTSVRVSTSIFTNELSLLKVIVSDVLQSARQQQKETTIDCCSRRRRRQKTLFPFLYFVVTTPFARAINVKDIVVDEEGTCGACFYDMDATIEENAEVFDLPQHKLISDASCSDMDDLVELFNHIFDQKSETKCTSPQSTVMVTVSFEGMCIYERCFRSARSVQSFGQYKPKVTAKPDASDYKKRINEMLNNSRKAYEYEDNSEDEQEQSTIFPNLHNSPPRFTFQPRCAPNQEHEENEIDCSH